MINRIPYMLKMSLAEMLIWDTMTAGAETNRLFQETDFSSRNDQVQLSMHHGNTGFDV